MKKKQKINKAVNPGEWILLGLTALFLCFLFALRERPAPERGISVRTAANPSGNAAAPVHGDSVPDASDSAAADSAVTPPSGNAVAPSADSTVAPPDNADGRVNLNTADLQSLRSLPGIGDALAGRIIAYREEHGPFARPEDVMRVAGIGQGKFDAMKALITV